MGNRSKRGRPDPDAPDPVDELQEESSWSGYTRDERWPSPGNRDRRGLGGFKMPDASEWVGIGILVLAVLLAMWGLFWLLGQILP